MPSPDERKVEAFLDAVARDGTTLSARDRIRVHLLAERRPELLRPDREAELSASWVSLLARSEAEYDRLEQTFRAWAGVSVVGEDAGSVFTRGQRLVIQVAVLFAVVAIAAILRCGPSAGPVDPVPSPTPTASASPSASPTIEPSERAVPRVRRTEVELAREITSEAARTRPQLDTGDVAALLLTALALVLALRLIGFLWLEPAEVVRNDRERIEDAKDKRRDVEKLLLDVPIEATPPSRYGFDPALVLETAGALQRLTASTYGPGLDGAATAEQSASSAGLFVPVLEERTQRRTPVVVLDAEGGDYVWFGLLRRLIADWSRHGVDLEVFTFTAHPGELRDAESGARARLDQLGRRARGPLLLCSRQLRLSDRVAVDLHDASVPAAWLLALDAWPVKAWIDPEPGAGVMEARAVAALERRGLKRFQATEPGLRALMRYLESEGERYERSEFQLPAWDDPRVRHALDLWRWAVALVPTPTWDFVERIRRARPEIAEVMKTRHHVRLLLDAVDAADQGALGSAGTGPLLELTPETYRRWLAEAKDVAFRDWAARLHSEELEAMNPKDELEAADRAMLLARNRARVERTYESLVAFREHLFGLAGANARIQWDDTRVMLGDEVPVVATLDEEVQRSVSVSTSWRRAIWAHGGAWVAAVVLGGLGVWALASIDFGGAPAEARLAIPAIARLTLEDAGDGGVDAELDAAPRDRGVPDARPRRDAELDAAPRDTDAGLRPDAQADGGEDVPSPPRIEMVRIPAGSFWMGSPDGEPGRSDDEGPRHRVTISRAFRLGRTEVTQAQWRALASAVRARARPGARPKLDPLERSGAPEPARFLDEGLEVVDAPSTFEGAELPVEQVSWYDAVAFSVLLSELEGLAPCYVLQGCRGRVGADVECDRVTSKGLKCNGYRLPTEAEWEYAARGGTETALYSGTPTAEDIDTGTSTVVAAVAWYGANSGGRTHPVGTRAEVRHPWGLVDMLGNVEEWCDDGPRDYGRAAVADPVGPRDGARRVIRGGAWDARARFVRAALRDAYGPSLRYDFLGFRLARGP